MLMTDALLSCLKQLQLSAWERRTYPKKDTCHIGEVAAEWYLCSSRYDRLLKEDFVVRKGGAICFRGDRRSPEDLFKHGFSFDGSLADFIRLYACNRNGSFTAGCCVGSLALLAYLPNCCCSLLSYLLLTAQCSCILCSYFKFNYSQCSPSKLCAMNLIEKDGLSSVTALSFSRTSQQGERYPMGLVIDQPGRKGYLYACYLPAPYVDFDALLKKRFTTIPSSIDDGEIFPLGAPVLASRYIIGAWKYKNEMDSSPTFVAERRALTVNHAIELNSFEWNNQSPFVAKFPHIKQISFMPNDLARYNNDIKQIYTG